MSVFANRLIAAPLRLLAKGLLKAGGWRLEGDLPETRRCVAVMAPHTSNWDFLWFLCAALVFRLDVRWMGKHTLFTGAKGPLMRWLGGIAVDRRNAGGIVPDTVRYLGTSENAVICIAPEGTRAKVDAWKTGFYRIAEEANVPILLTYLDYGKRVAGLGPMIQPDGNMDRQVAEMRTFYADCKGKAELGPSTGAR